MIHTGEWGRRSPNGWGRMRMAILLLGLSVLPPAAVAAPAAQRSYASPEAATAALVKAVRSGSKAGLSAVLGARGSKLISSGDAVADARARAAFVKAFGDGNRLVAEGEAKRMLVLGKEDWPFPIPLVKSDNRWRFDTAQGEQEILNRRIGRNELAAIRVCLAIVDAQREYAALQLDRQGVPEYAAKIVSSKDKHDGLYWPAQPGEPPSPLGPLVADAANEGYASALAPYHGYFYRILTAQGKDAPGGAYEYVVNGRMIGGFGVIAYPARYGASGIQSFMVSHDGVVLEKDLGENTAAIASALDTFNPDPGWEPVDLPSRKPAGPPEPPKPPAPPRGGA